MQNNIHNYLLLIWKDPSSRRNYTVGKLTRSDKFYFEYFGEYELAKEAGWRELEAFPDNKVYENAELFLPFSSRLPDKKRRDIKVILEKYDLPAYDEFELLRKSGARLPIDSYEFVDPIFPEDKTIKRDFFIMGIRHVADCEGKNCLNLPKVSIGDQLLFVEEPENENDKYAIRVETASGEPLGYVPRYYNQGVLERLKKQSTYSCEVIDINQNGQCAECIKVRLSIPKEE